MAHHATVVAAPVLLYAIQHFTMAPANVLLFSLPFSVCMTRTLFLLKHQKNQII
jgi:hypothetical protein